MNYLVDKLQEWAWRFRMRFDAVYQAEWRAEMWGKYLDESMPLTDLAALQAKR